jgi:thiol-disulfide isomerase/thioredoxin/DsbC/DsbD-like thiol-disulfide interchange protein
MRIRTAFITALGLVTFMTTAVWAQPGRPDVKLTPLSATDDLRPGGRARLALRVLLPEGWHVQSNAPRDPALIPTTLTLEPQDGITIEEIIYPAATDLKQDGQSQPLAVFGREFVIGIRVQMDRSAEPGEWVLKGQLRYQACTEKACYPPATAPLQWQLFVERPAPPATKHGDAFGRASNVPRAIFAAATVPTPTPEPTPRTLVAMVRDAMSTDFARAEQLVRNYRATHGITPEMLLALSWLGRGALADKKLDLAEKYAGETYELGRAELKRRGMDDEANFPTAFGAAIETLGKIAAERGKRSEAVAFLDEQLKAYGGTSLHKRIQKNINLLSMEGTVAPSLDLSEYQGVTPPTLASLQGKVVLLFFWAHWCSDCKAQGPVLEKLLQRYGSQGLVVVAPTQRFGYAAAGKTATPDEEKSYIQHVRQTSYAWMAKVPVTLSETNHKRYGVSSTPTVVVVDRAGIVRLYNAGQVPEAKLEELVRRLVEEKPGVSRSASR